jgi:hypothetical protein
MSSAFTVFAKTVLVVVVAEVCLVQLGSCFSKQVFLLHITLVVVLQIVGAAKAWIH